MPIADPTQTMTAATERPPPAVATGAISSGGATGNETSTAANSESAAALTGEDTAALLGRIERSLRDIRGHIETHEREQRHQEFPLYGWLAAVAQLLALLFAIAALMDWFSSPGGYGPIVSRVLFAVFFQLATLTALLAGGLKRRS